MNQEHADAFAAEWIDAWNRRDLDAVLAHWDDDAEFTSPLAARLLGEEQATLRGKAAIRSYWEKGLDANPDLHFELDVVHAGHDSLVIAYCNEHGRRCAELIVLGRDGLAVRGAGHYHPAL